MYMLYRNVKIFCLQCCCPILKFAGVKTLLNLSQTSPGFMSLQYNSFENTVGKGEIACNMEYLLFLQFSTLLENLHSFNLEESKICCLRKS